MYNGCYYCSFCLFKFVLLKKISTTYYLPAVRREFFICAIVNDRMNFNNHKLENIMKTNNNFKAMFVGILLIAATFSLMTSNTNGPTVFAQSSNNPRGVEYTVTISDL